MEYWKLNELSHHQSRKKAKKGKWLNKKKNHHRKSGRHFQYNLYELIRGKSYPEDMKKVLLGACKTLQHCLSSYQMIWPEAVDKPIFS